MNMQAIMKQAQKMQKDMIKDQEEIQNMIFEEENSQVYVKGNGKKEILEIKFKDMDSLDKDDLEMLSDSLVVVINKFIDNVDKETEKKMSKYGNGLNGLF